MEIALRAALVAWLRADAALAGQLNAVTEEAPSRTGPPWLALVSSSSTDWGCKDRPGREVRVALELQFRGDTPAASSALAAQIEARIEALPRAQDGFSIASIAFLRGRAEQRAESRRAMLIEYRFRLLAE
jgi:hypothetical protein